MTLEGISRSLDALGFPSAAHPDADAVLRDVEDRVGTKLDPAISAFLSRWLHDAEIFWPVQSDDEFVKRVISFSPAAMDDWSWDEDQNRHCDEDVSRLVAIAGDGGDDVFLLDRTPSLRASRRTDGQESPAAPARRRHALAG